jgi:hypothetical protein
MQGALQFGQISFLGRAKQGKLMVYEMVRIVVGTVSACEPFCGAWDARC